ncbi:c-type cytochrome [Halopseudomonas sabulinigri]|uniref:Cytochrome c-551 n=1 Tax=Halopseudomonas sabulinigri TaxID=472181 RepID=A0ABP9ZSE2_9GAMM
MKRILLPVLTASALFAAGSGFASEGEDLYNTKGCVACHKIDTKVVGPAYTEVAKKYAGQDGAVETVAGHIKNGVSGIWGPIPMPPNQVTEDEAKVLAEWVLSHN